MPTVFHPNILAGGLPVIPLEPIAIVTQQTNKSTSVTINALRGQITTSNAQMTPNAIVGFTVNNSLVEEGDVVVESIKSGATALSYSVFSEAVGAGSFQMQIHNFNGGNLSEALVISFRVLK